MRRNKLESNIRSVTETECNTRFLLGRLKVEINPKLCSVSIKSINIIKRRTERKKLVALNWVICFWETSKQDGLFSSEVTPARCFTWLWNHIAIIPNSVQGNTPTGRFLGMWAPWGLEVCMTALEIYQETNGNILISTVLHIENRSKIVPQRQGSCCFPFKTPNGRGTVLMKGSSQDKMFETRRTLQL